MQPGPATDARPAREVWLERLGRWVLAAIFLAAALPKIMDPAGLATAIAGYRLMPEPLINFQAITMPWVELVVAVALVTGLCLDGAVILANALLLVFLAALGQAWLRGLDIECGCFGHADRGHLVGAIVRDVGFLAVSAGVLWLRVRVRPSPGSSRPAPGDPAPTA